jgi:hypothetical protein
MTEEEQNEIIAAVVFAKMDGAVFKIVGRPLKNNANKLDLYLVLRQGEKDFWEAVLFRDINRVANMADLTQPDINSTMPSANRFWRRAIEGDETVYLKGRPL